MQYPIGVKICDSIEDLIEERFYHVTSHRYSFLVALCGAVVFDDVLE